MFLKKNIKKVRSLFSGFALTGITVAALFLGANAVVKAQTDNDVQSAPSGGASNKFLDFNGNGTTDFVTVAFNTGGPINWKVLGNPASPLPNQALIRRFNYGLTGDGVSGDGDSIAVGDYYGDGKTELAVFRNPPNAAPPGQQQGIFYLAQFPLAASAVPAIETHRAVRQRNARQRCAGRL